MRGASGEKSRLHAALLVAVVLAAVVLRLAVRAELSDYVLYRVPLIDAQEYVEWASMLCRGGVERADVYYKPPLYPWVLALWMRVFSPGLDSALLLNGLLGVLNVLLMAIWGRRIAGPVVGLVAAACAAVYGPLLYFEAQAMPTTLGITLALLTLLALGEHERPRSAPRLVGAGIALGLLVLVRPSFLLWVALACAWLACGTQSQRWRRTILVALVAGLTVLPVTVRNRIRGGEWVLVSANGGINFFLGNNPEAARTSALRPGLEWEELVRRIPEAERRGQARWDRYFARAAWGWVRDEPLGFAAGLGRKLLQYFNAHEIDRNLDVRGFRAHSRVLRWAPRYACFAVFLLVGLGVAWRVGGGGRLAVLFWISCFAATVLVFVSERYKVDASPAMLPLAVLGMQETVAQLRRRPARFRRGVVLLLIAAGALLAFNDFGGIRRLHPARAAVLEGIAFYEEGRISEAILRLQEALEEYPEDGDAHYQLGTALQKQNRHAEALQAYAIAARLVPGNPKPHLAMAYTLRRLGRLEEALASLERASAADPNNPFVHLEGAVLFEQMGDVQAARARYALAAGLAQDPTVRQEAERGLARLAGPAPGAVPPR